NGDGTTTIESMTPTVSGSDTITVSEGYNVIIGGSGQDSVTVQAGALGAPPATAIVLGDNGMMLLSPSGNLLSIQSLSSDTNGAADTVSLTSGTNAVIGGAGADEITAGGGTNTVIGDNGEAFFFANGTIRLIQSTNLGNGANDIIELQNGTNIVIAGAGADQITLGGGTNYVLGDEGSLEVLTDSNGDPTGTTEVESLNASVGGVDNIRIGAGFNVVIGGAAADKIETTGTAAGARGFVLGDNGKLVLSNAGVLLSAESTSFASGAADTITLTNGTNTVIGGAGADIITAGGGANTVLGDDGEAFFFADGSVRLIQSINLGNGANDIIELQNGTNTVIAGAGADQITLGGGTNYVLGDEGSLEVLTNVNGAPTGTTGVKSLNAAVGGVDNIQIGAGFNVVIGGAAGDTIEVDGNSIGARAVVLGDNGTMTLNNSGTLLSLQSSDFASGAGDTITLTSGTNAVIGGAGADQITSGGGTNTVLGDDGEAFFFADGSMRLIRSINLGSGAGDTIGLQDGTNTVIAGAGADILTLGGGTNYVLGDEGRLEVLTDSNGIPTGTTEVESLNGSVGGIETISVGAGYNVVVGGAAGDGITVNGASANAQAVVLGDNGKMIFSNTGTLLSIESTNFASGAADTITLTSGANAVIGGAGVDQITAGGGTNTVLGDDGKATFFADGSIKTIQSINLGNGASDTIVLQDGLNTVIAGAGSDILTLGAGTNYVLADEGQLEVLTDSNGVATGTTRVNSLNGTVGGTDQVTVGSGYNAIVGGAASDTIGVNGTTANARGVVLGDNGSMLLSNGGTLLSIESTDFAAGATDTITLTNGTNTVIGGAGDEQITAGAGKNTILGDDGKATFFANGDLKLIESINLGNGGNDTIALQNGTNSVIAGAGNDTITMGAGTNFVFGDEGRREVLTDSNGVATGNTEVSSLNGLVGGTDAINLGTGYNVAAGGAGADTITVNGTTANARGIVVGDNAKMTLDNSGTLLTVESIDFRSATDRNYQLGQWRERHDHAAERPERGHRRSGRGCSVSGSGLELCTGRRRTFGRANRQQRRRNRRDRSEESECVCGRCGSGDCGFRLQRGRRRSGLRYDRREWHDSERSRNCAGR
ncbi:MAG: calcium-binding protein, partial [Planctomycetales bacterium]|nr:calcium-binding protein [Planctomycetales bacterium]